MSTESLVELISGVVRTTAEEQGLDVPDHLDASTKLFGDGAMLDSLALVSLVVAVEQLVSETYGVAVELANDKALSQRNSPYRTIGSLAQYTQEQFPPDRAK